MISSSSSSSPNCSHWLVRDRICLVCKKKPGYVNGRDFDYLSSGLRLSHEAISFTKRLTTLISLYGHKKLHLVLDLDHTLLHSVRILNLSNDEKYVIELHESGSKKNLLRHQDRLIKFRPFVNKFLNEANKLFNMYVYTNATRGYARAVVRMLDPNGTYFGDKVITREDSPTKKTLDLVLADERGVLIVDDSLGAWPKHKTNVLQISRYFYFKHVESKQSYAEMKRDESRNGGALANLLNFLKEIHHGFFSLEVEQEADSNDVRSLLKGHLIPNRL